ncbi:MAG TPA: sulfatase [Myxococcota bacterium]|nr:sulfatase [Myxococcota bacterium]
MTCGALGAALLLGLVGCGPPPRPSVVVILVDTLRADHLGAYGYERPTSPVIDALARDSWVFERHVASAAQTVPSTLTLMLSLDPAEHGFFHEGDGHFTRHPPRYPDDLTFLAEAFAGAGYATAGLVGNPFLKSRSGFGQGFDAFLYSGGRAEVLTQHALEWLEQVPRASPFFLYLHYFDVHWPYNPPEPYRTRFGAGRSGKLVYRNGPAPDVAPNDLDYTVAMYDAEIAYVDEQVGRLLAGLERLGRRGETVVAVTSDHGEEFLDHGGLGHGTTVYGELVRVPLVLSAPQLGAPGRVSALSRHLDLAPTLLDLAGVPRPASFRGRSLLEPAAVAYSEDGAWRGVYADGEKLVVNPPTELRQRFAVDDARDQRPLAGDPDRRLVDALAEYESRRSARKRDGTPESGPAWSQEELERLRALGYAR